MTEYIVDFGDDGKSAVRIAMAKQHGAVVRGEIVRCEDCKYSLAHGYGCGRNQDIYDVEPSGFCAWGEPKEGGDEHRNQV